MKTFPPEFDHTLDVVVRRLAPSDDRSRFDSGDIELDRYFRVYAGQNQFRHHLGTTWVAVVGDEILGVATVTAGQLDAGILREATRARLPAYPIPVLRLARLAVSARVHGRGIGGMLVRTVFALAWRLAEDFGCAGVVVDAKRGAVGVYTSLGFVSLAHTQGALEDRPQPTPMFLELGAIPRP